MSVTVDKESKVNASDPLNQAGKALLSRFESLPLESLQAKPAPGAWSRQQVVEHMMLAYAGTTRELERRIEKGEPTGRKRSVKDRVGQFVVIRCGMFPKGRRAPDMVQPLLHEHPAAAGTELAAEYRRRVADVLAALDACEARWGKRVPLAVHPVLGPLSGPQWRKFHGVHTLHHVKQMDRIAAAVSR